MSYSNRKLGVTLIFSLLLIPACLYLIEAKVVDFGPKLPDLVEAHPDKSWLVKFYAPWCYHCQEIALTFVNVAEVLYNNHDDIIVGRVDCSAKGQTCELYQVQSYPTILFLHHGEQIIYKGDRTFDSLVDFAERMKGPDIISLEDCKALKGASDQRGLVVLSTVENKSSELYKQFKSLAHSMKAHFWFYEFRNKCKNLIDGEGIYLLKRHLDKSIKFDPESFDKASDVAQPISDWLVQNSFPVYGPVGKGNLDRMLKSGKHLVIALLDEYKPAKKFSQISKDLQQRFEKLAIKFAQTYEKFVFLWSSDLDLIQALATRHVVVPNVMVLRSDLSYHLLIKDYKEIGDDENEIPAKLEDENIRRLVTLAQTELLFYEGGNTVMNVLKRHGYMAYQRSVTMYRANPLLTLLLIGLPSCILLFVIYTTCCYDTRDDDDFDYEEEARRLLNHAHQD